MPSATECHNDICIAAPQLNLTRSEEPVALELRSVMSKIGFRIKGQGEKISKATEGRRTQPPPRP